MSKREPRFESDRADAERLLERLRQERDDAFKESVAATLRYNFANECVGRTDWRKLTPADAEEARRRCNQRDLDANVRAPKPRK